ncbi:hypothetical protein [Aureliella helgolandensis]|uniref:Uncharacterized protein n=1 Tax=Aureliella helgolandensis TaxID=2527968 RepID=A0A518G4A2_9BACT|nr:hypothetical protein [Aureliella helgolandensis]QDV23426.1 hypothetical protein Q31a_17240 [Aureliella helgolandensis]
MALVRKQVLSVTGGEDAKGPHYTIVYAITTDDAADGPGKARDYSGWSYGDSYTWGNESDSRAVAIRIQEQPVGSSKLDWQVTVEFGDPGLQRPDNPLAEPPTVEWGYEDRQFETVYDVNGDPILNAAGDRYDEIVYADDFRRKLTITRNEASFDRTTADALGNRLNVAAWRGYAAKTVKLKPIIARDAYNAFIGQYWVVTYEFTFAPIASDWKRPILEAGIYELVSSAKKRIIVDGKPAAWPVPLKANGEHLPAGGTPVYRLWELLYTADFDLLNLGSVALD